MSKTLYETSLYTVITVEKTKLLVDGERERKVLLHNSYSEEKYGLLDQNINKTENKIWLTFLR